MADRPIPFSAPMVRALLDGRKTQTRRVLCAHDDGYEPPYVAPYETGALAVWCDPIDSRVHRFPGAAGAAVGDRLWVREAWRTHKSWDADPPRDVIPAARVWYEADGRDNCDAHGRLRPARFMPRWASRLTLTVTDVRVQRVQEISEADAEAEGVFRHVAEHSLDKVFRGDRGPTAIRYFRELWDSLNAARGHGWDANPWVAAISFRVHRCNIDAMEAA